MTLHAGARLGAYEILAPLGAGGMGEVYRAKDARLGREVAIKVLPAALASDPERLRRFEKEARSASALNHPNIVTVYDIGESEGVSWIAMELVEGKTLRDLLISGALPLKRVLQIGASVAEGLARAHEAGVIHRDLKPENVMVTKDGLVKILDFGLAKLTSTLSGSGEGSHLPTMTGTTPGVVVGTVGYMSPEQASGQTQDFRSDQFALGSILYELTTGKRAFQKKTAIDTLAAILNDEPESVAAIKPQTPAPLRWVVERCLAKEPEERYVATRDLARDLATLRDRIAETSSSEAVVAARPARRLSWRALAAAAAIAAVSLLAGRLLWKAPPTIQPKYQRLTFGNGLVDAARFTPDQRTIVYSALWDGKPPHLYLTRPEAPESQRLDLPDGTLMSISPSGELAMVMGKVSMGEGPFLAAGTLATVPLAGGAPREVAENVRYAEWGPDGKQLLVFRGEELQFPSGGKVLHRGGILPRLSPAGDRVAFIDGNQVHVLDLSGKEILTSNKSRHKGPWSVRSLAWSAAGGEILFTEADAQTTLFALDARGKERPLLTVPRAVSVLDVARDGRILLTVERGRREVWAGSSNEARERSVSVFGTSNAMGISADGTMLLDNEDTGYYLLRNDGSLPKKLGEGFASELSPDGKWAAVIRKGPPDQLVLVPTGLGQERPLERGPIEEYGILDVRWSQNGERLLFGASEKDKKGRDYVQDVAGGPPRAITPPGFTIGTTSISPDGRFILVEAADSHWIFPTDGGERKAVAGFLKTDYTWRNLSSDGRYAYAWNAYTLPFEVFRVELATGKRELWKTIAPQDPSGIIMGDLMITPDGKSYAYNCTRVLSDLFLVTGVR